MRRSCLFVVIMVILLLSQGVLVAAGISDSELKAIISSESRITENQTLSVPGQGYFGNKIFVSVPYKEKLSFAELEYDVEFAFLRQVMDYCRGESEAQVEQRLAAFAAGSYTYEGEPLEFTEAGSRSWKVEPEGILATETIEPPQREEIAGGLCWYQRSQETLAGRQQIYYNCFYAARQGDFVATLRVEKLSDSKAKADAWFRKLIAASHATN